MSPLVKQYLKFFLLFGGSYGFIMYLMDTFTGETGSVMKYLFLACFFGAAMSLTLVTYHKYRLRKDGVGDLNDSNMKVSQSKKLVSKLSIDEIASKLRTDSEIANMGITKADDSIIIKTGMTWRSWGEVIKITINPTSYKNGSEYTIQSSPKLKTTLIDYGKNLHNVNRIYELISKE